MWLTGGMDRVSGDEGILSLTNVEEVDAGTYTCQAENLAGTQSRTIPVLVSGTKRSFLINDPFVNRRYSMDGNGDGNCKFI